LKLHVHVIFKTLVDLKIVIGELRMLNT
jgi:hypothetical protein